MTLHAHFQRGLPAQTVFSCILSKSQKSLAQKQNLIFIDKMPVVYFTVNPYKSLSPFMVILAKECLRLMNGIIL